MKLKNILAPVFIFIFAAAMVSGCGAAETEAQEPELKQPEKSYPTPIIERDILFGNPDKASPQISPDGAYLSYLAPVDGVLNVWVAPVDKVSDARPVTQDKKRGVRIYFWTYMKDRLIYLQDSDGDENWHVYLVDVLKGKTKDMTPFEGVRANIEEVSHLHPEEILISLNDREKSLFDVHRINLKSGEKTLVQENPGFIGFVTDDEYRVRFAQKMTADGGEEILKPDGKGGWENFMTIGMEDSLTTGLVGFDKTLRVLYIIDSRERNTAAFRSMNLDTGEMKLIAEDEKSDLADLMLHPTEKTVQAVAFNYERKHWQFLDETVADDFSVLRKEAEGDIEVIDTTLDDAHWIVAYVQDNGPIRYYRYDRSAKKAHFLFTNRSALEDKKLVKMKPVVIRTRDGLDLVNYISLPVGSDSDDDGIPDEPLPMVLHVHGGPWARVSWGYNPFFQWLANRGYAVMSVNFRGSTGFGKNFINAGNLEWAAKMHADLIDSVKWAVEKRIADPRKVAILGGSYGGYATLVGLTFTPETFACGVDIVGPSNLITLLNSIPPYWAPMINLFTSRVGDHRTDEGKKLLTESSPLTHVDRISKPLLIGQGANDPRVKQAESDQIVKAMQEKNIPVTYVLYSDEGHGFARPENRLSFFAVAEAFLSKCLGERYEPVGDDFEGSSIKVPAGAEYVPGLDTNLEK